MEKNHEIDPTQRSNFTEDSRDSVSEWLRRWTRNPLGSARAASNPAAVVNFS